nr:NYN domain-containing protein [uncultured Undibacterium sp.]
MLPTKPHRHTMTEALQCSASQHKPIVASDIRSMITGHTCIALDNSNVLRGGLGRGLRVDLALVLEHLSGDKLVSATMSASSALHDRPNQNAYYDWVRRLGWTVNSFALIEDEAGNLMENELLVDGDVKKQIRAAAKFYHCDSIVLIGGDGGFTNVVKDALRAGKNVVVIAWEGTLHHALSKAASAHASIDSLRDLIGRELH